MSELVWRKSSRSGGSGGGNCIEVANSDRVYVRDTKDRDGGMLAVSGQAWTAFLSSMR